MLEELGKRAQTASRALAKLSSIEKNIELEKMSDALIANAPQIIEANKKDVDAAAANGINEVMVDRLRLDEKRIWAMAEGINKVAKLKDPVGETIEGWINEDGLNITKKRVPLGVVGIIYESRPNVTSDAASLCFKTGNAVILKGGKEAYHTNKVIVEIMSAAIETQDAIQFIDDVTRESTNALMKLDKYVDVLIPRGGAGLINAVKQNSTVPIIETGTGICHVYVDEAADFNKALDIIVNAKVQRPSVCNAIEGVVINRHIATEFIPKLEKVLGKFNVEFRADEDSFDLFKKATAATEEDFNTEFLDYILSVKLAANLEEAIEFINTHNTKHSESIITENIATAEKFLNEIDAAAVYVNASTRFTDGEVFGFGAEIGISTQKLHARGPMGLAELTTTKYVILGHGEIRP
ncbi:MAG: glutamate-5-semialdehyde dehydrogenase [Lactobacillales bacterium]|jgi:glutamate-5-semialdehyde dehydrogenase|nr:glutamate-5-semialdehyde dehydrogenase [Lactobacillales bacterium]